MRIQLIDTLTIGRYWGGVAPNQSVSVQGTMDGACGIYALFNALVLGGHIPMEKLAKLWNEVPDGRSLLGKWKQQCGPSLLHGTDIDDLAHLLRALNPKLSRGSSLELTQVIAPKNHSDQRSESSNSEMLENIAAFLEDKENKKKPLLVGIGGPHINHWTVAVGCTYHQRENVDKLSAIVLIDPSESVPPLHAWNAQLSLGFQGDRRLRFASISAPDDVVCSVDGAWCLQ